MRFKAGFTREVMLLGFYTYFMEAIIIICRQHTQNSGLRVNDTVNHINTAGQQKHNIPLESSHFITSTVRV